MKRWRDTQGDVWTLGPDGLLHSPETRPFPLEHVEKKWGPLEELKDDGVIPMHELFNTQILWKGEYGYGTTARITEGKVYVRRGDGILNPDVGDTLTYTYRGFPRRVVVLAYIDNPTVRVLTVDDLLD